MPEVAARDDFVRREAARLPKGSWVLDAGAGASKYRPYFDHCKYQTQDFCQYAGPLVKYLQPIDYVCEITAIPLPGASLDAILCTEVFEHLVDPMAALGEFRRLLKPGGRLLLTAPFLSYMHMQPYHYYSGFTRYWYEHWLPKMGFSISSLTPFGGPARSASVFLEGLEMAWREQEQAKSGAAKAWSKLRRAPARLMGKWLLPALYKNADKNLGGNLICSSHFIVAERTADAAH